MKPNGVKALWEAGKPVINGWLSIANSFSAEIMAHQGWDSLTVDIQHGIVDYQSSIAMLQAVEAQGVTPMARVPWLDPAIIMKMLDAGAYGLICPMVNRREDAEAFVAYSRYAPVGTRSFGPTRANFSAGANYAAEANGQILCLAMIETVEAVKNLDEIAATPGLDGLYIGPADLALSHGYAPGFDREEPDVIETIQRIKDAAHANGIRAGLHTGGPAYAARAIEWGFDLVTIVNDVRLLAQAAAAVVTDVRGRLGIDGRAPEEPAKGGY